MEEPSPTSSEESVPVGAVPSAAPECPEDEHAPDEAHFWFGRSDQVVLAVICTVALGLMFVYWGRLSGWGQLPVEIERPNGKDYEYRLEINHATWVEWAQLRGIGEVLSKKIVEDRDANGPFADVDDLQRVKGIGPKKLAAIRPWLVNGSKAPD